MNLSSLIDEYRKCEKALYGAIRMERVASVREYDIRMNWLRNVIRDFDARSVHDRMQQIEFFLAPISQASDIHPKNALFHDLRTVVERYIGLKPNNSNEPDAEHAMPSREEMMRAIAVSRSRESAIDAIEKSDLRVATFDRDLRYTYISPANERFYGLSMTEIIGKHVSELIGTKQFEERAKAYFERCFEGEDQCYYYFLESEGRGRQLMECRILPQHDGENDVLGAVVVMRDLTDKVIDPVASAEENRV